MKPLIVDNKRVLLGEDDPCPVCSIGKLILNHDNVECPDCKYVKWDRDNLPGTGIFVRAQWEDKWEDKWGSYDIVELTFESLNDWIGTLTEDGKLRLIHLLLGHPQVEGKAEV